MTIYRIKTVGFYLSLTHMPIGTAYSDADMPSLWASKGYGEFGFYKYAAPTELKTDIPFVTFQKLFDLLKL